MPELEGQALAPPTKDPWVAGSLPDAATVGARRNGGPPVPDIERHTRARDLAGAYSVCTLDAVDLQAFEVEDQLA
jgi:hypothetical protein